jgi:uncharacterized protein HemY
MRSILWFFALVAPVVSSSVVAQPAPAAADPYRNESLVFERSESTYRMHSDGTGEKVVHVSLRIQSQGAAQQFGVLAVNYASANETPHITFARVHKPDGTTVDTPVDNAIDMPAEVTRAAPLYSDLKQKHLAIRSLSVGDTLEYEVHVTIDKPETPGQFWGAMHFTAPGTIVVLSEVLNLEVPKDKYVQVWSPNHKPTISERDSVRTYTWNVAQLVPAPKTSGDDASQPQAPKDPDEDSEGRKIPSVAWTTFRSWTEVGDWYKSMASGRANPTEMLQARANEITRNAKTPEEQARAIFEFVSSKVRYIGIDFGVGRYQPHAAAEVLSNEYGDCKDKDTLLEALLRAKGFTTAPALIGAGIAPVAEVPTPAIFNHVITTVDMPSGRIWLDSTPEVAPFGYLSPNIRDQKALVMPDNGPASLATTPANAPYPFTERFEAHGTLTDDGKLTAKMSATYHDDAEVIVRAVARNVAPAQWDKASQFISSSTGFGGTTSNAQFKNVDDLSTPISVTYDYLLHPFGDWDNHRIVPLFPALEFPQLPGDGTAPKEDIDLGAPRQLIAISHIELPERYTTDFPDPIHVKTDFATFDKTYRFEKGEIIAERTITVLKKKVAKDDWKSYEKFAKNIGLSGEPWIQLIPPSKPIQISTAKTDPSKTKTVITKNGPITTVPVPAIPAPEPKPVDESASAGELMDKAREQLRSGDWISAKATLEAVKKKNPDQEFLYATLGSIALMQRNYDQARSDFEIELKEHPDNAMVVGALADAENRADDAAAAQKTLKDYLATHPDELRLSNFLASLQLKEQDYDGALATMQSAADHHPKDPSIRIGLGNTLVRLNRMDEAAAAAKSILEDASDPGTMNDAAYILSETGRDLAYAETMSRKSVDLLEQKTASITTAEANSQAFATNNLLIASWDTLGWILYQEGKYDEAHPFIMAGWRNGLNAEVGDHLGQLYEAMKKPDEACAAYRLADATVNSNTAPEIKRHIHESFTRLEAAGAKPGPKNGTEALQNSRTYKLGKVAGATGWGTFRIQLAAEGVVESQQMSGDHSIAGISDSIRNMKFPELLPPGSKAHLLRSAVVSCSESGGCELVLVPDGGLQTERQ